MTKQSTDERDPVAQLRGLAKGLWLEEVSSVELIREFRRRADIEFIHKMRCGSCLNTVTGQKEV
ncbi:hypothetical protein A3K81_04955 [Candidatus Bathyarchaeota archaeon RBG_13_60_20]|nr:MAG: hypothetical protein A3K81_04955 [Candidatus Bathyarchaeota archaeon RBG_13_60_20]